MFMNFSYLRSQCLALVMDHDDHEGHYTIYPAGYVIITAAKILGKKILGPEPSASAYFCVVLIRHDLRGVTLADARAVWRALADALSRRHLSVK